MNAFSPYLNVAVVVAMFVAATLVTGALRRAVRSRALARQRVVERPNSHYTSPLVRNGETKNRWKGIALDRVHEVNRGEVERLIARVDALGVESLRESERVFLDQVSSFPSNPDARQD